ncbi:MULTISPECIES: Fur family transcriptional regulator [Clostridium]|uniref:Fur family transcriptional regulator, peroxide stress response regulator n=1 Tax=Clostridium cadaveris TaxID=1529 RepID=A0A1I2MWF4_9CLOT|nr:Fur family transcriptional regulator [Clostridium cadaveris]MDU4953245.1 Fur family transcriptional regulator [Clostridium sp.]MDM8312717.1 Fur family transcriptional regulator [Clostridium cadaveris]MDY4948731.1 Fur family transcriptional regulator [Clostridium cadaveris]NME65402.1 transcriptional repressor [Clostridium cadaveris]NWK11789.1 transcriptional repressor [Clostridium cadaveris]
MDNITTIFKEKKLKLTPQRIAVYKYLQSTKEHPSAETIYKALQEDYPTMSLATVYKALKTLVEVNLVQELNVGEGNFRYDGNVGKHPHIQCVKCGRVDDIEGICFDKLNKEAADHIDYDILSNKVYFYGICPSCK